MINVMSLFVIIIQKYWHVFSRESQIDVFESMSWNASNKFQEYVLKKNKSVGYTVVKPFLWCLGLFLYASVCIIVSTATSINFNSVFSSENHVGSK